MVVEVKALELVAYVRTTCADGCCPKWANPRDWSLIDREWFEEKPNVERSDYDASKRFTPAELAAEDWRRKWTELRVTIQKGELSTRQQSINETMLRFITLPNYDEVA